MELKYNWIFHVIESCKNEFHFACADILISLFSAKYGNSETVVRLKTLKDEKLNAIDRLVA